MLPMMPGAPWGSCPAAMLRLKAQEACLEVQLSIKSCVLQASSWGQLRAACPMTDDKSAEAWRTRQQRNEALLWRGFSADGMCAAGGRRCRQGWTRPHTKEMQPFSWKAFLATCDLGRRPKPALTLHASYWSLLRFPEPIEFASASKNLPHTF